MTPKRTATRRVRVVMTRVMYVDVDAEEAERLVEPYDFTDVYDSVGRFVRIAAGDPEFVESDVEVEAVDPDEGGPYGVTPLDGNGEERYLWHARHFVNQARYELSCGRYRQGHCPDLDRVNGQLAVLEDELRFMALDAEGSTWPDVAAWREARHATLQASAGSTPDTAASETSGAVAGPAPERASGSPGSSPGGNPQGHEGRAWCNPDGGADAARPFGGGS